MCGAEPVDNELGEFEGDGEDFDDLENLDDFED
jgi:hypothetical protein